MMAQEVPALKQAAIEYVLDGHEPYRHWQAQLAAAESADDGNAIAHAHSALEAMGAWSIPAQAATILAGLGFTEAQQQFPVAHFSGGWRMRLNLARVLIADADLLLLDEPTNHLDLDMREALAEALSDFDGAIVLVSHDRHLIGLVSDSFWRVADGAVKPFDGDLDEYAAWLRARQGEGRAAGAKAGAAPAAQPPAKAPAPARKANPHKLAEAEDAVARLEAELAGIDAALADPANHADPAALARLGREREAIAGQLAEAEERWLELLED